MRQRRSVRAALVTGLLIAGSPLAADPPTFPIAPTGDEDAFTGSPYKATVVAAGSPAPDVVVESPDGAEYENQVLSYSPVGDPGAEFTVRLRATNADGEASVEWDVTVVEPVFLEFEDEAELGEFSFSAGDGTAELLDQVDAFVDDDLLWTYLPGGGAPDFDQWCGFDRTPRWIHEVRVAGTFALETRMEFLDPPLIPDASYHVGLVLDRGPGDLGQFGAIRGGVEYERTCSLDGENSGTVFPGTFGLPGEDVFLRVEVNGKTQRYLARLDIADPWTEVWETRGARPPIQGVGFAAKNWGQAQGDITTLFDYLDYGPLPDEAPTIAAPASDRAFTGGPYTASLEIGGFPDPELEVLSPEGATITPDGVVGYTIDEAPATELEFEVQATNRVDSAQASWTVRVVQPVRHEFDTVDEFFDVFYDPGHDSSLFKDQVVVDAAGGELLVTLPGTDIGENFDQWCGFDRTPRWLHDASVTGTYAAETALSFDVPPPTIGGGYHVGLCVDRGTQDLGQFGAIRNGVEYERTCSQGGENTDTFFPGLFSDPEGTAFLRIESSGNTQRFLARTAAEDPWTLVSEVVGPRPRPVGIGIAAKNWGAQGQYTAAFDYFDYGPPVPKLTAPDEDFAFEGGRYAAPLSVEGFPEPVVEVSEPADASVDDDDVLTFDVDEAAGSTIDVRVTASNDQGTVEAEWQVNVVAPVAHEFDTQQDFDGSFVDSMNENPSERRDEVTTEVVDGALELFLPGVLMEDFDSWCGFDRTPRFLHQAGVTGSYTVETELRFALQPPDLMAGYHGGLVVDRGRGDLGIFGPIRNGVEYERTCSQGGENTGTFFGGLWDDPDATVQLRIDAHGTTQTFLARRDPSQPWTLVSQVEGRRPSPEGIGLGAKNWGAQGDYTLAFERFTYGPSERNAIIHAPRDEQAFRGSEYVASVRTLEPASFELLAAPEGAAIDEEGDVSYTPTEAAGTTLDFEVRALTGDFEGTVAWQVTVTEPVRLEFDDDAELEQFTFSAGDGTAGRLAEVDAFTDDGYLRIFLPGASDPNFDQWCGFDRAPRWLHELQAFSSFDLETRVSFDPALMPANDQYHTGLAIDRGLQDLTQFGLIRGDVQAERTCNLDGDNSAAFFADVFQNPEEAVTLRIEKRGVLTRMLARLNDENDMTLVNEIDSPRPWPRGVGIATKSWGGILNPQSDFVTRFEYFEYGDPDAAPAGTPFVRGDADASGAINITDGIFVLNFLFTGGADPTCTDAADVDDSGTVNITDGIFVLNFLFTGGAAPPAPHPDCGVDPQGDDDGATCAAFAACP